MPVSFGPMTTADVMDGAFDVIKRRPREMAVIAAVTILPLQVLMTVIFRDFFSSDIFSLSPDTGGIDDTGSEPSFGAAIAVRTMSAISLAWTCGAVSVMVADWYRGIRRTVSQVLIHTAKRSPSLVAAVLAVKVVEFAGAFAFLIGAVVAMAATHVVSPVVALETANPFKAVLRSTRLTMSQPWRSLVMPVLAGIVGVAVTWILSILAGYLAELTPLEYTWIVTGAGQLAVNMVVIPFTAGVAALYYLDLRVRREGLDLQERANALSAR